MFNNQDITQHYIGWKFFRNDAWRFPIGFMTNISYPLETSIIFTDSIPLFAIIFKILSPILPETFQYFGLFGLLTFFLQGLFSYILVHRFVKNKKYCIIASVFFVVTTPILQRMFGHTALAANFIITMALCLWAYQDKYRKNNNKKMILWTLLLMLSTTIHIYYILMTLIIMVMTFICDFIKDKKTWKSSMCTIIISCLFSIVIIYLLGGLRINISSYAGGKFGVYISNLNTLINPSYIGANILKQNDYFMYHNEGMGYLGFGIILMLIIDIYEYFKNRKEKKYRNIYFISGVILFLFTFIISTGLNFYWGTTQIFQINLPQKLVSALTIFRATGRFIWIADYILILGAIVLFYHNVNNKKPKFKYIFIIIIPFLLLQLYDLQPIISHIHKRPYVYLENNINNNNIYKEVFKKYDHIIFMPATENITETKKIFDFSRLALESDCTINVFHTARTEDKVYEYETLKRKELYNGKVETDTIYVFLDENIAKEIQEKDISLYFYKIEDTIVAFPKMEAKLKQIDLKNN